jgi:thiamine-phosphate pyrophosphorylase
MRPVVCMITAPIGSPAEEDTLVERIASAARAGAHLIQIRQPHYEALALTRLVERARQAVAGTAARVLVNDRVDVALSAGAHGVHLRSGSMPAARVREIVPAGFVIGRSVHALEESVAAEREGGLDYLLFGTVFATGSKPGVEPAGVERLAAVCASASLPVLGIGGMTVSSLPPVGRAGAAGFAAIGLFAGAANEALPQLLAAASSAFDTPRGLP